MRVTFVVLVLFAASVSVAPAAMAQDGTASEQSSFFGVGAGLPTVYILDQSGRTTAGKLTSLSGESLRLDTQADGPPFEPLGVIRIQRRTNALKWGGLIGGTAVVAVGIGLAVADGCSPEEKQALQSGSCPGAAERIYGSIDGAVLIGIPIGVSIGALIPRRETIWSGSTIDGRSATSFEGAGRKLATLFVRDHAGRESSGTLVGFDEHALVLDTGFGRLSFTPRDLSSIQRRGDSLVSGATIGAVAGAVFGVILVDAVEGSGGEEVIPLLAAYAAAIGATVDAMNIGKTTLWQASSESRGALTLGIVPALHGLAAKATLRW